eukprot:11922232-Alexandrium_andersonii.AAC.1
MCIRDRACASSPLGREDQHSSGGARCLARARHADRASGVKGARMPKIMFIAHVVSACSSPNTVEWQWRDVDLSR